MDRKDIETFLKQIGQNFRIDKSNFDEGFFRNKIRHRLIPFLEKEFNPKIKESLFFLSQNAVFGAKLLEKEFLTFEREAVETTKKEDERIIQINVPILFKLSKEARIFFLKECAVS